MALSAVVLPAPFGPDHSEDATFFDMQIDAVQRYSRAERLAKTACFYRRHGINVFSMTSGAPLRHPALFV